MRTTIQVVWFTVGHFPLFIFPEIVDESTNGSTCSSGLSQEPDKLRIRLGTVQFSPVNLEP